MRSEHEKMLAGVLYDPLDPELLARRTRARDLRTLRGGQPVQGHPSDRRMIPASEDRDRGARRPSAGRVRDAMAGGMWGLLVGDALGVPYEFRRSEDLRGLAIDMPPPEFPRSHPNAPPQAWSDDGAHALCLLASLVDRNRLDLDDLGQRLLRWYDSGYMAVRSVVFDVGIQTRRALSALRSGASAEKAGPSGEWDNGNGSLMRVLPLALWHRGSDEELIHDAARQSLVTHAHVRSQVCCALYCLWIRAAVFDAADPWEQATRTLRRLCAQNPAWTAELDAHVRPEQAPQGSGTGYVVDCLHSARLAAQEATFDRVVRRAVALGNDTDTTAAVAGGFAGVRDGLSGIPERWLSAIPEREVVEPLVASLLARWDDSA